LIAATLLTGAAAPAPPRAVVFEKAALSASDAQRICALAPRHCASPARLELYRTREGAWWAIAPSRPALLSLARGQEGWTLTRAWDFADRIGFVANASSHTVHPALYPVADGVWAAAVVETRTDSYSGGGAAYDSAVFVPLDGRTASPLPGPAPFSCSRMVRACFSERDYSAAKHCHDEWTGWLTLSYGRATGQESYVWSGTWRETAWPQGVAKSAARTTATPLAKASFCEFDD